MNDNFEYLLEIYQQGYYTRLSIYFLNLTPYKLSHGQLAYKGYTCSFDWGFGNHWKKYNVDPYFFNFEPNFFTGNKKRKINKTFTYFHFKSEKRLYYVLTQIPIFLSKINKDPSYLSTKALIAYDNFLSYFKEMQQLKETFKKRMIA